MLLRYKLEKMNLTEDVRYFIESLYNYATTNQLLINHRDIGMGKVVRTNYYPDKDGKVVFYSTTDWNESSYSVGELLELLELYGENIKTMEFQACDGNMYPFINFGESHDVSGEVWYTHIIVGNAGNPMMDIQGTHRDINPNIRTFI